MTALELALIFGALGAVGWIGFKAGWDRHGETVRAAKEAEGREAAELAAIMFSETDSDLTLHDAATGQDALGRKQRMLPEQLADLRSPKARAISFLATERMEELDRQRALERDTPRRAP